ncbi:MAG: hypothetical protein UW84_C0010G0001, partial [Candidatus Collierbacteria bacterium GW2011_GWA2_44_99]
MGEFTEQRNKIKQLDEGEMKSVAEKLARNEDVPAEDLKKYKQKYEELLSEPILKSSEEKKTSEGFSPQDLKDAAEVLREDRGIEITGQKLTHDMTPGQMRDKLASDWLGKNGETADSDLQRRVFASLGQAAPAREPAQVDWSKAEEGFDRLVNPLSYGGNPGQRKAAAERWLRSYGEETSVTDEMRDQLNKIINPEMDFADDLKEWVREFCLESVFERNAQNYHNVLNLLVGPGGALNTEKNIPLDKLELLKPEIQKIVEELGLDNFISIRNTISEWDSIKKLEEITSSALKSALFVPEYTEKWFEGDYDKGGIRIGDKMVVLPGENGVAKNMQEEVSEAILKLKNFFDNNDYWEGFV